jgi:hypothetical protein
VRAARRRADELNSAPVTCREGRHSFVPPLPSTAPDSSLSIVGGHPHSMAIVVQNLECVLRGGRQVSWCRRSFDARNST